MSKIKTLTAMTPRVRRLWQREMDNMYRKRPWWGAGLSIYNGSDNDRILKEKPVIIRKAMAFDLLLSQMKIEIAPGELVVGNLIMSAVGMGRLFPEYATEAEIKAGLEVSVSPKSVWGHSVPDYEKLLRVGLRGIIEEARQGRSRYAGDAEKESFFDAVIMTCQAAINFAGRYADLAHEAAKEESDAARKEELLKIAKICRHVPENPARDLWEAMQSFWFVYATYHNTLNWIPAGRVDNFLNPYWEISRNNGMRLVDAQELMDCLWLKFSERTQIKEEHFEYHKHPTDYSFGRNPEAGMTFPNNTDPLYANQWNQTVNLGGVDRYGNDAVNDLSYVCLESTRRLRLTQPTTMVRLHNKTPEKFFDKCAEVISEGGGMPAITNDDARINILTKVGVPVEDARDHVSSGCWEIEIAGKTEFRWNPIHGLKCVEWLFTHGVSTMFGVKEGLDLGDIGSYSSFQQILDAFKKQLDHYIKSDVENIVKYFGSTYQIAPCPFLSALMEGCLESGMDITQGGSTYILYSMYLTGLPNIIDSLAAIKKMVFDDTRISLEDLKKALVNNFSQHEDLRLLLANKPPKYGNDDPYTDDIMLDIVSFFAQRVRHHTQNAHPKILFPLAIGTDPLYLVYGGLVGATPDGRKAGSAIATNFSPVCGMAQKGIFSTLNSYTKVDYSGLGIDAEIDLSVAEKFVQGNEGHEKLKALIKSFLQMGGPIMCISVLDVDTLKEAQVMPEAHKNLRVRAGGWQAYFVAMGEKHQQTHIKRVAHGI
jgi:formate C-acetyltransferase